MSYRPITDVWILARPKVKYYGAYPAGFLSRARELLGVSIDDPVLHVCSGMVRDYPFRGLGPNDRTLDADGRLEPDYCIDVTEKPLPKRYAAILADPPYTETDAAKYRSGPEIFPKAGALLAKCIEALEVGRRVGILHYEWPRPPANARSVAVVGVLVGFSNRIRCFSVFERAA
jgi:hypothetical protein